MEDLQQERARLDAEWEKLRIAKEEFALEMSNSSVEQKLFVGNLDEETTEEEIRAMFAPFGDIKEVFMLRDKEGKSKRSSFVKMFTKASAERAIEGISGKIKDKTQEKAVVVRFAAPKTAFTQPPVSAYGQQQQQPYGGMAGYNNGFGGYGQTSGYGSYGADTGYGAAASYGARGMGGGSVGRGPSGSNLYINNVAPTASEDEVRAMFADFGNVLSIKLFASQGYGFVSFDNPQSASNAIHALNGLAIGNGQKRLEVSHKKDKNTARFNPY